MYFRMFRSVIDISFSKNDRDGYATNPNVDITSIFVFNLRNLTFKRIKVTEGHMPIVYAAHCESSDNDPFSQYEEDAILNKFFGGIAQRRPLYDPKVKTLQMEVIKFMKDTHPELSEQQIAEKLSRAADQFNEFYSELTRVTRLHIEE